MGNRGILHDENGRIRRAWQVKRWLVCVLEFRGRRRTVMAPGRYTELFFLDESTALAAGHRPCAECRRGRFLDFCDAWGRARPRGHADRPTAAEIDDRLHTERLSADRQERTVAVGLHDLPNGVLIAVPAWGATAYLVWEGGLWTWSPGGYRERRRRPTKGRVLLLTPPSTVAAIRAGYVPEVHVSARR
jgi:hypothetical protein